MHINQYLNLIDGLVITGGDFDINPEIYGKKISSKFVKLKNGNPNMNNGNFPSVVFVNSIYSL